MAITTIDGAISGRLPIQKIYKVAFNPTSHLSTNLFAAGSPAAASSCSAGMAGEALTSLTGQIPFVNPVSGYTYLHSLSSVLCTANLAAKTVFFLVDRLWQQSGIDPTSTGAQTINSVAWPARDNNGSTNGEGVIIAIEQVGAVGSLMTSATMVYTNQAGTGSKTGTLMVQNPTSSGNKIYLFALDAGDTGVRSIQSITLGASLVSGTLQLAAYRIIFMSDLGGFSGTDYDDPLSCGFPRLFDNSVLHFINIGTGSTQPLFWGSICFTQG